MSAGRVSVKSCSAGCMNVRVIAREHARRRVAEKEEEDKSTKG
jgi:hypothetical protein